MAYGIDNLKNATQSLSYYHIFIFILLKRTMKFWKYLVKVLLRQPTEHLIEVLVKRLPLKR